MTDEPSTPTQRTAVRTGLDTTGMTAWRGFIEAHSRVLERLSKELLDEVELPMTWYDVLVQLSEAEEHRLRMQDLADRVLLSQSGVTRLVDRMVRAGLVARARCTEDGRGMFALLDDQGAVQVVGADSQAPTTTPLGEHTLLGEICDSKCFLGVMKPGSGKTHRACAVRCIASGIPPIFVTRDANNEPTVYLLVDDKHQAINEAVLPFVAEPVQLKGALERQGDLLVYVVDPSTIARQ